MQTIYKKKQNKKSIIFVVVCFIFLIINPFNIFGFVQNFIMIPLTPITKQGSTIGTYISDKINMISSIGELYNNNQILESKIRQLESENVALKDIKNENERLRKNLKLLPRDKFQYIGGDVILHDSLGGNQWIMINRGKKDGVIAGKAVIVDKNILIGVVDKVTRTTARVQLITHPDSIINVITVRTGAQAIASGLYGLSIVAQDIKMDDDVINGDVFITSDIGNSFPRGLTVGTVQDIKPSMDKLFRDATILPSVSMNELQHVFVIK